MKLNWPVVTCRSVPWASHSPSCNLHNWSHLGSASNLAPSLVTADVEQTQGPFDVEVNGRSGASEVEVESTREDGELPSLNPITPVVRNAKFTPLKVSDLDLPRRLPLISKSFLTPASKGKSPSFRKQEEDLDVLLESETDEPVQVEPESDNTTASMGLDMLETSWIDCEVQEYYMVLLRKLNNCEKNFKLEARVWQLFLFSVAVLFNLFFALSQ